MILRILSLVAFVFPFVFAILFTPVARMVALAAKLVAPVRPDRLHRDERPYGGGIAVLLAAVAGYAAQIVNPFMGEDDPIGFGLPILGRLAVGAILFFALGLLDDRYVFSAWAKLLLQLVFATVVVVGLGLKATVWLRIPWAPEALSILWIVAVVNAYNMLDHADGLAAGVGAVALAALALGQTLLAATLSSDYGVITEIPIPAMAIAGALAGFLVYNYPPAKLFMGDAGSMPVGFLLAALAMESRYYFVLENMSRWVVLIPLALLAVPLFDMVCVTLSRIRRGESPFRGDATSHLAHRMLARGWSPRGIVVFAAGAAAVTGGASVAMYFLSGPALVLPWLAVAAVLVAMLLVRRPVRPEAAQ
jgi:UDP-GlcNAc:undecaprenyl-phosphate GlcNAc-1-phosphate transferase